MPAAPLPLVRGTLDALVLKALSWTPMHGFEITCWMEEHSSATLDLEDGALYHALNRLEERRLIKGQWGVTEHNRRARYYSITAAGRAHLAAETDRWLRYSRVVTTILTLAPRRG
jgi:transcriptional regulator